MSDRHHVATKTQNENRNLLRNKHRNHRDLHLHNALRLGSTVLPIQLAGIRERLHSEATRKLANDCVGEAMMPNDRTELRLPGSAATTTPKYDD